MEGRVKVEPYTDGFARFRHATEVHERGREDEMGGHKFRAGVDRTARPSDRLLDRANLIAYLETFK